MYGFEKIEQMLHFPFICYRGIKRGYCEGNKVECTVDCGGESTSGLAWVKLSASQNYPPALVQLGTMHLLGNGAIKKDAAKAYSDYFEPAADAGDQDAQFYLGKAYAHGLYNYSANPETAWMWFSLAVVKANLVGDDAAIVDIESELGVLREADDGSGCNATCQIIARAIADEWMPEDNACKLKGTVTAWLAKQR